MTEDLLRTVTYVMAAVVVIWSVAAILLAALVWRRSERARRALVVSASVAAVFLLFRPWASSCSCCRSRRAW